MQVFVIVNNVRMKINADVNVKNWLTKGYVIWVRGKGYVLFECDKSCDVREYLGYANCKCWKRLIDTLVEEFTEKVMK